MEVDIREEKLEHGDIFLLCSDGLTNMLSDERIQEIITSGISLESSNETLLKEANQNGGKDNISSILIRYI